MLRAMFQDPAIAMDPPLADASPLADAALADASGPLARALGAPDGAALVAAVRQLEERLARVGRRITGDADDGRDAAAEALARGAARVGAAGTGSGTGSFAGWLHRVASRCAFDALRRRRRTDRLVRALAADPRTGPTPEGLERSVVLERAEAVRLALGQLTELQRATVLLRHFESLSVADIAALRGTSVGTVKATLFQAFTRLREALAEHAGVEGQEAR